MLHMSIKEKFDIRKLMQKTLLVAMFLFLTPVRQVFAEDNLKVVTYFTGIGCSHCAKVSPFIHDTIQKTNALVVIEYEIYQQKENASLIYTYSEKYNSGLGIPMIVWGLDDSTSGDSAILRGFESRVEKSSSNVLLSNSTIAFEELDLNDLSGLPKLYAKDRALVKVDNTLETTEEHNELLKRFLTEDIDTMVDDLHGDFVADKTILYPGGQEEYKNGLSLDGWNIFWNGTAPSNANVSCEEVDVKSVQDESCKQDISIWKTIMLALTDSINPCALSVLTMMLIAIVTYHPKDRKQILWSGLAFVAAVFFTYIIYGLLIVKAFQVLQSVSTIKVFLYKGLGIASIILGLLEIKDFFFYKPGSIGTEMPLGLRPKVQKLIARVTSPWGAFTLGMFVTLFLLPCTIGPYVILGGILSVGGLWASFPHLLLYNTIFVLPMVIIIVAIFFGTKKIKDVEKFREKNIKVIHLVIGVIFLLLGIVILTGAL